MRRARNSRFRSSNSRNNADSVVGLVFPLTTGVTWPLSISRSRCVLVLDHLIGLIRDRLVDLLERLLGCKKIVCIEEFTSVVGETIELPWIPLSALTVVERDLLDDPSVNEFLRVLVDCSIADAWIQFLEFVHRWELLRVLEDIAEERKPRLLGDKVDQLPTLLSLNRPEIGAHTLQYKAQRQVVYSRVNYSRVNRQRSEGVIYFVIYLCSIGQIQYV
jgi:hypothetical protein